HAVRRRAAHPGTGARQSRPGGADGGAAPAADRRRPAAGRGRIADDGGARSFARGAGGLTTARGSHGWNTDRKKMNKNEKPKARCRLSLVLFVSYPCSVRVPSVANSSHRLASVFVFARTYTATGCP